MKRSDKITPLFLDTGLQPEGGCDGGEYSDDYFQDFTPDRFIHEL